MTATERKAFRAGLTATARAAFDERLWVEVFSRPDQLPPDGFGTRFGVWLNLGGRGSGKTRTGAETVRARVRMGLSKRISLIERTPTDARETMIEGDSGLLSISPPHERPKWQPAKGRLTWPNGAIGRVFTAADADKVRGFNADFLWAEELGAWREEETWYNALLALRVGENPCGIVTTTNRGTKLLKALKADPTVHVTRCSTWANAAHLAPVFFDRVVRPMMGSVRGRVELEAEDVDEAQGALWSRARLDSNRVSTAPDLQRIVVAIDPAASTTEGSDETGIVACGKAGEHGYVLADASGRYKPEQWAARAIALYRSLDADLVVAEKNNGGDMVRSTLANVDRSVRVKLVHASRGKHTRADPISALSDRNLQHHVGAFPELEDQLCLWEPGEDDSPDRLDAYVWGMTELFPPRPGATWEDLYPAKPDAQAAA